MFLGGTDVAQGEFSNIGITWTAVSGKDITLAGGNNDPRGIYTNGTTMWVADEVDNKFYAYTVSSKARDSSKDFNLNPSANWVKGIWSNGTTMWWADDNHNKIFAQTIGSNDRDSGKDVTLHSANSNPAGIWSDGTTMYVADSEDDKIYAYNMSSKQRDTAKEFDLTSGNDLPAGIWSDGTTLWVVDQSDAFAYPYKYKEDGVYEPVQQLTVVGAGNPIGIWSDGTTLWVSDDGGDKIFAYTGTQAVPDVTVTRASASELTVTWDAVADVDNYYVHWRSGEEEYTTVPDTSRRCGPILASATRTCTMTGLTAGTDYDIRVRAYDIEDNLLAQTQVTGNTFALSLELPDTGLRIKATWPSPPGATAQTVYEVGVSQDDGVTFHPQCTPVHPTLTCTFTIPFASTYVGLEHIVKLRVSGPGGPLQATATITPTLGKATDLTATAVAGGLRLTWDAVSRASGYIVQWKTASGTYNSTNQATPTANSYTISGLWPAEYTVRVRANHARAAAVGPWSDEGSQTPLPPGGIPGITWSLLSATSIKVEWPPVSGGSYFADWKTRGAADSTYSAAAGGISGATVGRPTVVATFSGLTANTDYTIRVEASGRGNNNRLTLLRQSIIDVTTTPRVPDLEVSVASPTSLKVDWGAVAGTSGGYDVYWKSGDQSYATSRRTQVGTSARTATITGLTTDETYTIKVEALGFEEVLLARSETVITLVDKPGYTVNSTEITIAEGSSTTYTIKLRKKPTHDVRILPTDKGSRFTVAPTSGDDLLTFTPSNWNTEQSVTLTAVEDDIPWRSADPVYARWVVRTKDTGYQAANFPPPVKITINDNDTARIIVDLDYDTTGDQHSVTVEGGECVQYRIKLASQPYGLARIIVYRAGNIYYSVLSDPGYDGPLIVFYEHNWDDWRYVDVCADASDGNATAYIYNKAEDSVYNERAQYQGVNAPTLTFNITAGGNDPIPPTVVEGRSGTEPANTLPSFDSGIETTLTLAENSPAGTNVGAPFTATDPDEGDALTYTLLGTDAAKFAIDGDGQITTIDGVPYDYERRSYLAEPAYSLAVNVSDRAGSGASLPVTVTLTDVDDAPDENLPPEFHAGETITLEVAEGSPAGTNVGKPLTAFDANGDELMYLGLYGADSQHFNLDTSTGQLTTKDGVTYDYDVKSTYDDMMVIVIELDTDELHMTGLSVTVNLTEADTSTDTDTTTDTAPTVADTSKFKTHYATVGESFSLTLPAADADSGNGGPYAYSLLKRSDGAAFSANGLSFDATTRTLSGTPTAEATHELAYHIHDSDANTAKTDAFVEEAKLKVVVVPGGTATGDGTSQQQQAPPNREPAFDAGIVTKLTLDENSPAATNVGSPITATDPDEGDTVTYSLSGTDAASFDIGSSTGQITTKTNLTYDFETKSSYTLAVNATDGKLTASTPVTIDLNDVNEAPAIAADADTTLTVDENSGANVNVGSPITATDPDKDATLTYSLSGTDAASFAIGGSTGQITTATNVEYNYETKSSYSLTVDVSDGKLTDSIDVTVDLNNVNEAPAFADGTVTTLSVDENSAASTKVGSVFTATDPDSGDTLAYSLSGTDAAAFNIGALTGQIATKTGITYNYEAKSSYSLTVVVSDSGGLTDSVAVTVSLNNVAEAPTVADTTQFKNHAATVGQTFSLTLPAADENSGDGGPYEYLLWHRGAGQNFMDQAINGLRFNATTRTLSGTPAEAGVWQLSYVVHDNDDDRSVEDRFRARTNLQITVAE